MITENSIYYKAYLVNINMIQIFDNLHKHIYEVQLNMFYLIDIGITYTHIFVVELGFLAGIYC